MKNMTIWQRLNTALLLLILLLLVGVGLAVWGEKTSANVDLHSAQLNGIKDRLWLDVLRLSESVRGVAGAAKTDAEKKKQRDIQGQAEAGLRNSFVELQRKPFSQYAVLQ